VNLQLAQTVGKKTTSKQGGDERPALQHASLKKKNLGGFFCWFVFPRKRNREESTWENFKNKTRYVKILLPDLLKYQIKDKTNRQNPALG